MFSDLWSSTRKRKTTLAPTRLTPKLSTTTAPDFLPRAAQDAQRKHVRQVSLSSSDTNDEPAFQRLERSQLDGGGDHPRGALPSAPIRQRRERDRVRQQPEASLMAQRKPESARKTSPPPSLLDGEEEKEEPPVRSRQEQEQEKERQPRLPTNAMMDAPEENSKLETMLPASLTQRKPESARKTPPPLLDGEGEKDKLSVRSHHAQGQEKERQPRLPINTVTDAPEENSKVERMHPAPLTAQRKPENAPKTPPPLLDGEEEKDEPPVRSRHEQEREMERQPRLSTFGVLNALENSKLETMLPAPLTTQRKPESARKTPPPPPFLDGGEVKDEPSVRSHHEQEREKERQPRLPTNAVMDAPEENSKLETILSAPLTAQRKPENAPKTPPPLLDEEEEKDEPPVRSRHEQEREKERQPRLSTFGVLNTLENEKLETILRRQTQQLDATQERTERKRSRMQSEAETLKQELDAARVAHKREVETLKGGLQEHGQRVEHLTADCERVQKDGESIRGNLNAEIERLKLMHAKEIKQLNAAREEVKQERSKMQSEAEKLRGELNAVHEAHKEEVKVLKIGLQEHVQRVEHLTVDRERVREDGEFMKGNLSADIEQLKLAHVKETERFKTAFEEANSDRTQAHSDLREVRKSLDAYTSKLEESYREMEALRHELSNTKDLNGNLNVEIKWLKVTHAEQIEQLDAVRREMKQERSQMQSEAEKLRGESNAARETHKREVDKLKMDLLEHVQRVEHERVQEDGESIKGNLSVEIERLKLALAKETERFKKTLEKVNLDRTQAHSELREVRKSLDAYPPKLDESLREIEVLRRELSNTKDSNQMAAELKQRLDIQTRELYSAREESSASKTEMNRLLTHLENRTSDPKSTQNFLGRANAFSGTEVTSIIQRLNAEVLQSTAFMAESMTELLFHKTTVQVARTNEKLTAHKRASSAIGGAIVHFLSTKKHKDDPILIQIAFQACLTYHLRWIACAWIIGGDESHNRFIDAIYRSVHEKEAEVVAGRWRVVTRAHVPLMPPDNSQTILQIANRIISNLSDILLTTGCNVPKSGIASTLSSKFSEKLSFLVSLAMRVNKLIGEDVTSGDLEVTVVPPAAAFDETEMEDSYDSGRSAIARGNGVPKVLCATDLGLRKKTRVGTTSENQWEIEVLLKPKVALESIVDILDE